MLLLPLIIIAIYYLPLFVLSVFWRAFTPTNHYRRFHHGRERRNNGWEERPREKEH